MLEYFFSTRKDTINLSNVCGFDDGRGLSVALNCSNFKHKKTQTASVRVLNSRMFDYERFTFTAFSPL